MVRIGRALFGLAVAAGLVATSPLIASAEPIAALASETARLDNGLTCVTVTDPQSAVASVQVWYRGGPRLDPPGRTGLAHLFEHLLFESDEASGEPSPRQVLQREGGGSGAYTTPDALVFLNTAPAEALETCLAIEARRMGGLTLREEAFERQRRSIRDERYVQFETQPLAQGVQELLGLLHPTHPYGWSTFGRPGDLDAITFGDVQAYYKERIAPDQAILVVVSPRSHREVLDSVRRHFGKLRASGHQPAAPERDAEPTAALRAAGRSAMPVPVLAVGYRATSPESSERRVLEIVQWLLAEGSNSRLSRTLLEQDRLALAVNGSAPERVDPGSLQFLVYVRPGAEAIEVENALFAEIDRLAKEGPTPEELSVAQDYLETKYLYRLLTAEGRAQALGQAAIVEGKADRAAHRAEDWRAVTAEQVRAVAARVLAPARRCVLWMTASEEGR